MNRGPAARSVPRGRAGFRLPKKGIEGEDTRMGLCGATPNTIAARNFARMVASGAAAHSDHGRGIAEVFLAAARGETEDYKIQDTKKLVQVAQDFDIAVTVGEGDDEKPRDMKEIAVELGEKALAEWGQQEGEIHLAKRAPKARYDLWKKLDIIPRGIDREVVEIMHRTHMGVDQDYKNIIKQCSRAALADGWAGSMIATDLQDILFGSPVPIHGNINLGVLNDDEVNIIVHGHEPLLSEMLVVASRTPEMQELAKAKGAKGVNLAGMCCTANEILMRHGLPIAGNYLQQELAIITGAVDAMVVDVQCIMENIANVAKCFHTKVITTNTRAKMEEPNVVHIQFDEHHALDNAKQIIAQAIENYPNRRAEVMIPDVQSPMVAGFTYESIEYHLGGSFRGTYFTLNDNIINGRIRGIAGVVGCNNARTMHDSDHLIIVKELLKNDVIVLTTGCNAMACGKAGLLTPEAAKGILRARAARGLRDRGHSARPAHGVLRGQQPDPDGSHGRGQGRWTGQRHQRPAGRRLRPGMDEREGDQHRPVLRRLGCLHGLRCWPAGHGRSGVPGLPLQPVGRRAGWKVGRRAGSARACAEADRSHRQEAQGTGHRQGPRAGAL